MSGKSSLILIYALFWAAVLAILGVSIHMGLNSTYAWYTEKTSFNMYLAMTLLAIIVLEGTFTLFIFQRRRTRSVLSQSGEVDSQLQPTPLGTFLPLILMSALFLACSAFALATLPEYLNPNYKINTVFILFTGSLSKIAVGLLAVIAFKSGLRRIVPSLGRGP